MAEDKNSNSGKISGKSTVSVETKGKIAGDSHGTHSIPDKDKEDVRSLTTRKDRISKVTSNKGLNSLSANFGDSDGDWQIIESDNLFEVLYLDHNQIDLINPDIVKNNYILIENFWKEKKNLWESGSVQVRKTIEDKYGEKNLNNCTQKLVSAYEQLSSLQRINEYYQKYRNKVIKIGENKLEPLFNMMLKDGEAEPDEMENIFEEGLKLDLYIEEIAVIIKTTLDSKEYKPYGTPKGKQLKDQLLSVSWMTEIKFQERKIKDAEIERNGREIFENQFAYNVEDIGKILFENEEKARNYINKGLLANVVNAFSIPKSEYILDVSKSEKNEYLRYLMVVYRLNPKLPFRFSKKQTFSVSELCSYIAEDNESLKLGKENYKQGNIETWLKETNKEDYQKFIEIRDSAENSELAFLEFIYTFNKSLPYRFAGKILVNTPVELCSEIDKNNQNWEAGVKELFDSSILIWLKTRGKESIVDAWNNVKKKYSKSKDAGLEVFLHLLNAKLAYPSIKFQPSKISVEGIQMGNIHKVGIQVENGSRGYLDCDLKLTDSSPGLSLSKKHIFSGPHWPDKIQTIDFDINSNEFVKGKIYKTSLEISCNYGDPVKIPVTFKVIFPKSAFIKELLKYSVLFALLGIIFRSLFFVIGAGEWLNRSFSYYVLYEDIPWNKTGLLSHMPILFFLIIAVVFLIIRYRKFIRSVLGKIK